MRHSERYELCRRRVGTIIDIGTVTDYVSRGYDIVYTLAILVNLAASVAYTFDFLAQRYGTLLLALESVTVAFFALDYALRLWTADYFYRDSSRARALARYVFSFTGAVDLLSFLPHYLPFVFPAGAVAFRMFRVVRIFRLFRINAYYDSLHVITQVLSGKKQQLLSSVFIILVLMLASSLCMYSLEHEAQPEVFSNAFSGIWWAASTLLTIGYGDIYPITPLGKFFSIVITFLGVGLVAIPTGIISAGFVEQYSRIKRVSAYEGEEDLRFLTLRLGERDAWVGREIRTLALPEDVFIAAIRRGGGAVVPRGGVVLRAGDELILGARSVAGGENIALKEITLKSGHKWAGRTLREIDLPRGSTVVTVRRRAQTFFPASDFSLREGDRVVLCVPVSLAQAAEDDLI